MASPQRLEIIFSTVCAWLILGSQKNLVTWQQCCRQTSGSSHSHQPEKSLQENLNATPELPSNNLMALKNWPNKSLGKTISHIHPQEPVWFQWDNTLNSFSASKLHIILLIIFLLYNSPLHSGVPLGKLFSWSRAQLSFTNMNNVSQTYYMAWLVWAEHLFWQSLQH